MPRAFLAAVRHEVINPLSVSHEQHPAGPDLEGGLFIGVYTFLYSHNKHLYVCLVSNTNSCI